MKPDVGELRKKYIENPPEGMTSKDIRRMSEDELLDMGRLCRRTVAGPEALSRGHPGPVFWDRTLVRPCIPCGHAEPA